MEIITDNALFLILWKMLNTRVYVNLSYVPLHNKTNNLHIQKTKMQISCTADLRLCFLNMQIVGFVMQRQI